ncbi:disease resistance protein RPM1-like [Pyrus ussuriensis x Pyrus communis]|uniref:Disease resistance protein RPM1-like n=1 Tax=Pyrus ussuriensis x Pyrus communis TaxID=2448454 RepID=A0A5N5I3W5_9ROSA|nr:disease resistance protein RPM1-like [Pyrus ussuriensis x Pyrus communis]KAB2634896.1 disease resistance protein RPM1-like [Pyrus ussuriensis x Pyrus communis]
MAESVVTFLLNSLTSLIEQEERLFSGVRAQIEDIIDELERIKAFLRVADTEEDEDPQLKVWVKQVRGVAYEIEDALDKFRLSHSHVHRHGFHAIPSKVRKPQINQGDALLLEEADLMAIMMGESGRQAVSVVGIVGGRWI